MKRSKIVNVDGRLYKGEFIGKGTFSRVFRVGDRVVYYTKGDCIKEVLSLWGRNMMHLPEIIRHDDVSDRYGYWNVYSSPYYRNVSTKDASAWRLYKRLVGLWKVYYDRYGHRVTDLYDRAILFVNYLYDVRDIPRSIVNALGELVSVSSNCGSGIGFDFHKANFGVNDYGVLIFRDVVFHRGSISERKH